MRLVRVMCSGRVDLEFVLRAFSNGTDGVFIGGCRLNECNFITHGNFHALTMVLLAKRIMEHIGMNPERLRIRFMSGADANLFVESVNSFVQKVKELGPLGQSEGVAPEELKARVAQVTKLVPYIKRVNKDKLATRLNSPDEYDTLFTKEDIDRLFSGVITYYIDPDKCQACMICARRCPEDAIMGGKNQIHVIDQEKCIKCETCFDVCPPRFAAVKRIVGEPVPPPLPADQRMIVKRAKTTTP